VAFNSFEYFLFLPIVWLVHLFLGDKVRWLALLIASLVFYASLKVPYLLGVVVLVTVTTYIFGLWMGKAKCPSRKKWLLCGGISANLLILIGLKYLPFLTENLNLLLGFFSSPFNIHQAKVLVTIGASYYIFQAVSYLIDIYLEIEEPETQFGFFALYMAFFPKLLQGPIERTRDLLPQFKLKYEFNYDNMRLGLLLFAWGLFKKVVLADRLGVYVDTMYDDVHSYQGLPLVLATYAYGFQIYFDFSGYTDMALGTARLFNINLTQNFNSPYLATSVADFWRRWHITFSRWILDYIFKPLQMQWRKWKNWGTAVALLVTFLVSGVWHGASWAFIVWGVLHGLYMACSVFYRPYQKKVHKVLRLEKTRLLKAWQVFVTFNLVTFAWIFFRATKIEDAFYVIKNLWTGLKQLPNSAAIDAALMPTHNLANVKALFLAFGIYGTVFLFKDRIAIFNKPLWFRWSCYVFLLLWLTLLSETAQYGFVYYEF